MLKKEFTNEFGKTYSRVLYIAGYQVVVLEWHGYTTKRHIEAVASWVEEFVNTNPCKSILNDCSNIISVWEDAIDWFSRIWLRQMKRAGLDVFINIAREGGFGEIIGEKIKPILTGQVKFYSFKTRQEAIKWLEQIKP